MFAFDRSRRFRQSAAALGLAASFGLSGSAARAGTSTVDFSSTSSLHGLAGFKGSATLDGDLLTVQVTNASRPSSASSKGLVYGLAFDIEGGKAVYEKNDGKHGFKSAAGKHGLLVKPFGRYDDALKVAGNKNAIAAGAARTFLFQVSGEPADATVFDLLNNPKGESVVALFKGFRHGRQDKAGAAVALRLAPADSSASGTTTGGLTNLTNAGGTGQTAGSDVAILPPTLSGTGTKPGTRGTTAPTGGTGSLGGSGSLPGSDPAPAAIPLPPAAWTGLGTLAVLACVKLKRRGLKSFI
jgi:hypothetical protein